MPVDSCGLVCDCGSRFEIATSDFKAMCKQSEDAGWNLYFNVEVCPRCLDTDIESKAKVVSDAVYKRALRQFGKVS